MNRHLASAFKRCGVASAACVVILAAGVPATAAPEPTGEWLVAKGIARIRIVNCGSALWGVVAWEKRADTDRNNPDPRLRSRPTLGMPILLGMKPAEANRWEGEIYNSQDGKTYQANISLRGTNVLQVRGCVMGFLCGGEDWSRVKPEDSTATAKPPERPVTDASGRTSGHAQAATRPAAAAPAPDAICQSVRAK